MQARLKTAGNDPMIIPGAMDPLKSLAKAAEQSGRTKEDADLVHLRAEPDQRLQRMR